jgi:hypothetical protein
MTKKDRNFLIQLLDPAQISTDFPDADFLGVGMKLLIGEEEVCSRQTTIPAKNDGNF